MILVRFKDFVRTVILYWKWRDGNWRKGSLKENASYSYISPKETICCETIRDRKKKKERKDFVECKMYGTMMSEEGRRKVLCFFLL